MILDRDTAGKKHTLQALEWDKEKYIDRSDHYKNHKDLNEWLIHNNHNQSKALDQEDCFKFLVASYGFVGPKPFPSSAYRRILDISSVNHFKTKVKIDYEAGESNHQKQGGRPKKYIKKDCRVSVRCSYIQRKAIQAKAKSVNFSVSEYLLKMGLTGNIDRREKVLPKEVLQLIGKFNHTSANLNQIAKKRNGIEPLTAFDRANLLAQSADLKTLTETINNYLK